MRTDITIQCLYSGLILFAVCFLGMMANLGSFVVIVSHFLPGLILGIMLMEKSPETIHKRTRILFIIAAAAIHVACAFFVDIANDNEILTPLRLIIASSIGAVFLSVVYDILTKRKVHLTQTFILPFFMGIAASVLSAICMYFLYHTNYEERVSGGFIWAGIFSIFPLWFYLFAQSIRIKNA